MFDRINAWATAAVLGAVDQLKSDEGQTFVEYALILAVVVVGVLLAVTWSGLKDAIGNAIAQVSAKIGAA